MSKSIDPTTTSVIVVACKLIFADIVQNNNTDIAIGIKTYLISQHEWGVGDN